MSDPMADPRNYEALLKMLGCKTSYTWDEVHNARYVLNQRVLNAVGDSKQKIKGSIRIILEAERTARQVELIHTLVEEAKRKKREPANAAGKEKRKDLRALENQIGFIDQVAVPEKQIRDLVEAASCEMRDAHDALNRLKPEVVILKDVNLGDLDPLDDFTANRIRKALKNFESSPRDLYQFLGEDETRLTSDLLAAAKKKQKHYNQRLRHEWSKPGGKLAGECLEVFKSDDRRRKYDHALIASVGDERSSDGGNFRMYLITYGGDGRLERREIEKLFKEADEAGLPRERVIQYIWSWALDQGIDVANVRWPLISDPSSAGESELGESGVADPHPAEVSDSGTSTSTRSAGGESVAAGSGTSRSVWRYGLMTAAALCVVTLWPDPGAGPSGVSGPGSRSGQTAASSSQQLSPRREEEAMGLGSGTWRSVQAGLAAEGFYPGGADGIPGPVTREALRRWQRSKGLPESGYLNAEQVATFETGAEVAARRAREDSVVRGRDEGAGAGAARTWEDAAGAAAASAREDPVARELAREDAVRATVARARDDSVARARDETLRAAARAAAARAREDSVARAREDSVARAREDLVARAREDSAEELEILSHFRDLELELVSAYAELTTRYLGQWKAVNWGGDKPSVERRGNRVDSDFARSNRDARDRLRQSADRLLRERSSTPGIETAHREFRRNVDQHYDRLGSLIGNVPGKVGALFIDVNPSDAIVYINDVAYGAARGFANEPGRLIPSGTLKIRVERTGYSAHEETVRMRPYERHFIRGNMMRSQ